MWVVCVLRVVQLFIPPSSLTMWECEFLASIHTNTHTCPTESVGYFKIGNYTAHDTIHREYIRSIPFHLCNIMYLGAVFYLCLFVLYIHLMCMHSTGKIGNANGYLELNSLKQM